MGLPSPHKPSRFLSPLRARQLHRALQNLKLSLICGLLTVLVLRGALGAGKFGTPAKDFEELRRQFERVHRLHARKHASRVLAEVVEDRHRPLEATATVQAHSTTYYVLEGAQAQSDDGLQGNLAVSDSNFNAKSLFDLTNPHALIPRLSDGDVYQRAELPVNPNYVRIKPKVMLVTAFHPSACGNPTEDAHLLKSFNNKFDYCKLHGIDILYNSASLDAQSSGFSAKLQLLRKLMLTHPEVEWFWWMDSDAFFSDMAVELPLGKYENYNAVFHGWDGMIHKPTNGAGGLNSGSFLIRNCQWALKILDAKVPIDPESRGVVRAGKLLAGDQLDSEEQPLLLQFLSNEKRNLKEKLPVEEPIYVDGYWKLRAEKPEEGVKKYHDDTGKDSSQPFVMRVVQHKLCEKGAQAGDFIAELHLKDMGRHSDIADSQALQLRHKSPILPSALERLRGGRGGIMVSHSPADQSKHISHSSD